jgi:hypothetical protein
MIAALGLPRLLDNRARARAACLALWLAAGVAAIDLACCARWQAEASAYDYLRGGMLALDIAGLATWSFSGVAWLLWFRRANDNARALGLEGRWWPGWAVVAWLVPVVNLVWPWRMSIDLWRHSATLRPARGNPVVPLFANFTLAGGLYARAAFELGAEPSGVPLAHALRCEAAADVLLLIAAAFALRFVRSLTAAHAGVAVPVPG